MKKVKNKFQSEIHIGLLVIVIALLSLNFASNYIIFKTKSSLVGSIIANIKKASLSVSRNIQDDINFRLTDELTDRFKKQYQLSSIFLISSSPSQNSPQARRAWFQEIIKNLPPGQIPEIANKILKSEFQTLTRGENSEYFYVFPVETPRGKQLLIISQNNSDLAYLDDASMIILMISVIMILGLTVIYFKLFRFIVDPFRKMKKEAIEAGRDVSDEDDDIEAIVADYQKIIDDLKIKESELVILNEAIQRKADSLEHFNRYLVDSMVSGVITLDNNGRVLAVNNAAKMILNLDDSMIGRDLKELGLFKSEILNDVDKTLNDNENHPYREYKLTNRVQGDITLGITIFAVFEKGTNKIGASILMHDLTEVKQLRMDLENKNKLAALGEMSAGLAHQLRNSLGAVLGYTTLIKKRMLKNDIDINPVVNLEDETREAEQLINKFLSFARPMAFNPSSADVVRLIEDVIESFKISLRNEKIKINLSNSIKRRLIKCDSLLLKQALSNIIDNAALAYDNHHGLIEIKLSEVNNNLIIKIIDYACGIKSDDLEHIFTPFYSTRPSGNGLGLSLTQKIINLHDGHISVKSTVDRGTEFSILLPIDTLTHSELIKK